MTDQGESDHIELSIAAQPVLLQLARLTAGVVAARADFDLNDVEDLKLAVDELCLSLMGTAGVAGRLRLRYGWNGEMTEVSCTLVPHDEGVGVPDARRSGGGGGAGTTHPDPGDHQAAPQGQAESLRQELSSQILDALVDEHGETVVDGYAQAWLRMRRTRPGEG